MSIRGRAAVITGSTSGIGLAIAQALAAEGANVVINGLDTPAEGQRIAGEVAAAGGAEAIFHGANMMNPEEIADLVRTTEEHFGGVDILVNNAGIQHTAPTEEFSPEKWDAIIAVNLSSAFHMAHAALPHMHSKGWGRIINTASVHGLVASAQKAAYVAAKHGIVGLTKVIALENADRGITCNAICPGWVETPLIGGQIENIAAAQNISIEDAKVELVRHKQPSRRFVQPEEVGALAAFLCSDAAASITGTALPVDGGWTAQ